MVRVALARLPSCDRLHAGVESDLHEYVRELRIRQRYCRLCERIKYQAKHPTAKPRGPWRTPTEQYGVTRLSWPVPELT